MQPGNIHTVCTELRASTWPFEPCAFSSIVCVQFPYPDPLLDTFCRTISPGGFLYLETFGGHGENYLDLPRTGHLKRILAKTCHLVFYRENSIRPRTSGKVSVKLLARRH
jgi:hypothetical protein